MVVHHEIDGMCSCLTPISFNDLLIRASSDISMTPHLLDYCRLSTSLYSIDPEDKLQWFFSFKFTAEPNFWASCSSVLRSPRGQWSSGKSTIPESTVDDLALGIDVERPHLLHWRQLRSLVLGFIYHFFRTRFVSRVCYRGIRVAGRFFILNFFVKVILESIIDVRRSWENSLSERSCRRRPSVGGRQPSRWVLGTTKWRNNNSCETCFFTNFAKLNSSVPLFVL